MPTNADKRHYISLQNLSYFLPSSRRISFTRKMRKKKKTAWNSIAVDVGEFYSFSLEKSEIQISLHPFSYKHDNG